MNTKNKPKYNFQALLTEDWLAVWISILIILLSMIGVIGPKGLNITF